MISNNNFLPFIVSGLLILTLSTLFVWFIRIERPMVEYGFKSDNFDLPFFLTDPDTVYTLPNKLNEISGLSFKNGQQIYVVNDEKALLYLFDFSLGKIVSEIDFGKNGDYEALTRKENLVYIAESNGDIKVVDCNQKTKVEEFETPLSNKNDVEGLCYDSTNDQLLIACKGKLENNESFNGSKGIYAYDLSEQSFDKKPYLLINLKKELTELKAMNIENSLVKTWSINSRIKMFAPSGLAIDPITKHLYILANRGGILAVADEYKKILGVYFLDKNLYGQPEGIVFDDKGNLYISNERNSKKANIVSLKRKVR